MVESSIADLRSYGHIIKMYVVDDAFAKDQTVESYEESELGLDYSDYSEYTDHSAYSIIMTTLGSMNIVATVDIQWLQCLQ